MAAGVGWKGMTPNSAAGLFAAAGPGLSPRPANLVADDRAGRALRDKAKFTPEQPLSAPTCSHFCLCAKLLRHRRAERFFCVSALMRSATGERVLLPGFSKETLHMRLVPVVLMLPLALGGCLSFSSSHPPPPANNTTIVVPPGSTVTQ